MDSSHKFGGGGLLRHHFNNSTNNRINNLSISLLPEEEEMLKNTSAGALGLLNRFQNRTGNANDLSSFSGGNASTFMPDENSDMDQGRGKTDLMFSNFFEILQSHSGDNEILDLIQQLSQVCTLVLDQLQVEIDRGIGGNPGVKQREASISWLRHENHTWSLLYALYYDRLMVQVETPADDEMQDNVLVGGSEKEIVQQLYAMNPQLREYQLIVDWLEKCYESNDQIIALHNHDRMMAWENTLFHLENLQGAAFGHGYEICKQLDPDAPVREGKALHALDMEDNMRLGRAVFASIRQGNVDNALKLCKHYGQTWRTAILEGWRLHEDPNFEHPVLGQINEKLPAAGNPRRDIWKRCAWLLATSPKYDEYTRATAAVFCGHLNALKSLLRNNWQDLLWAHIKVQIDIRVESEIRRCCMKVYQPMPDDYWNGKMTLEQIFEELSVAKDVAVRDYAHGQLGVIQQHLILDNSSELLQHMCRWLDAAPKESHLPPHQLRFMAHIVLFMRQIGRFEQQPQQEQADRIIGAYVEVLIPRGDANCIAYYSACLPKALHMKLYAKFLMQVDDKSARELAVAAAVQAGLDVVKITQYTVETIWMDNTQISSLGESHSGAVSATDRRKIKSLEYLVYLNEQRGDLLWQTNAMIRHYLASEKIECFRMVFSMMPSDLITQLINIYGALEELPPREECCLKEFLCYKVYLVALDSFNDWTRMRQGRPQAPQPTQQYPDFVVDQFSERLIMENKELEYRTELSRWEQDIKEQAKTTSDALFNVLLFPEDGWLNDPFIPIEPDNVDMLEWDHRELQMEKLRSICLPEIANILHGLMLESGDHAGCIRLADEIADERRKLYKVFNKHKLAELLIKMADTSLTLLNSKVDPWGYPITT